MVISTKTIIFQGFRQHPTFSRGGGVQLFPGGGGGPNTNFYRNPYNRRVWPPYPPLDPHILIRLIQFW